MMNDFDVYLGEIRMFAGTYAPYGWRLCDGSSMSIATYGPLYAAIGTTYGGSSTKGTFKLPDLMGRVPVHAGQGESLSYRVRGESFGEEKVEISEWTIPAHTHRVCLGGQQSSTGKYPATEIVANGHYIADCTNARIFSSTTSPVLTEFEKATMEESRSAKPHQNTMPSMCVNYIICVDNSVINKQIQE
jgi:microcystin-dependent protein